MASSTSSMSSLARSAGGRCGLCCMQEAHQAWHGWKAGRSGMVAWEQQVTGRQGLAGEGSDGSSAWLTVCRCCRPTVRAAPGTPVPSCSPPPSEATCWPRSTARPGWAPSASWPSRGQGRPPQDPQMRSLPRGVWSPWRRTPSTPPGKKVSRRRCKGSLHPHTQGWVFGGLTGMSWPPATVGEFPVVVQRTEAATRCQLKGPALLVLGPDAIQLREAKVTQVLYSWPYHFLRKFGSDKGVFSFEAGRRCDSGEGLFAFHTPCAPDLCRAVAEAITRQRERLPELARAQPCPLPRATSLPSLDAPGELREMPPGPEPPTSRRVRLAEPGPQSLPLLLGLEPSDPASGLYASVCKRASGLPRTEHLYENLCVLEASPTPHSGEPERHEGPGGHSPTASPIYHNGEDLSWPSPAHDSSLEAQYRRLLELDEAEGTGRPDPQAGFKAKLVNLLSRERRKGPAPCDRP
ncbi:docking protein 3 isoform X1 [Papio anubis]|uniref:docking protein 3 isoform X1 n=1 Tax=Papio anubis TaxID=9555 RepID=UPI000B7B22C0|nr:docking protein 3 isoform X1 [Papio anubis]XP_021795713.1 docking protein 3 isoform X1 [Papio anubis]XP_031522510.1 docking protein 3 isoform X1 [Papio anubis]XP_031522511.1 docking protein 3 isoform X1 [Papio anubis]